MFPRECEQSLKKERKKQQKRKTWIHFTAQYTPSDRRSIIKVHSCNIRSNQCGLNQPIYQKCSSHDFDLIKLCSLTSPHFQKSTINKKGHCSTDKSDLAVTQTPTHSHTKAAASIFQRVCTVNRPVVCLFPGRHQSQTGMIWFRFFKELFHIKGESTEMKHNSADTIQTRTFIACT